MKNKYVFGGFIIVVFLGLLGYLLTQSNIKYEEDFTKVKEETNVPDLTFPVLSTRLGLALSILGIVLL